MLGDQFAVVAIPLTAIVLVGGGPMDLGLLTAAGLLPSLLLSLGAGVLIDRTGHRRRWMLAADVARALAILSLPLAHIAASLTVLHLYLVALAVGAFDVVFFVAYQPLLLTMVRGQDYLRASSLLNASRAVSQVAGLSAGGALVAVLTAPVALVVNAASFVVSGVQLARIRPLEPPSAGARVRVRDGLRWIRECDVVRCLLLSSAVVNLFAYLGTAVLLLYATQAVGLSATAVGLVLGLGALGGVAGAATFARLQVRSGLGRSAIIGSFTFASGLAIYPAARGGRFTATAVMLAGALVSTVGIIWADLALGAILAQEVPDGVRARVAGAYRTVNVGVRPVGAVLGGVLGATFDVRITLLVSALGALGGTALRLRGPLRHLVMVESGVPPGARDEA